MPWVKLPPLPQDDIDDFVRRFQGKARLLVDESAGEGLARALRDSGWNAVFVGDVGLIGHSDEDVFARAWRDDQIILTHDTDFLDDARFPFQCNPGLVVLPVVPVGQASSTRFAMSWQ